MTHEILKYLEDVSGSKLVPNTRMKYSPYAAVFKYQEVTKSLVQGKIPYIVIESSSMPTIRKL